MTHSTPRLRSLLSILFGTYLFIYPWSIVLVALDRVPVWGTWMGGVLLIIQGSLMGLWLAANFGRYGVVAVGLILVLSWLIEHIGVTTGFPFGTYIYTDELLPKILGVVPLAIPFAWLLVVPAAVGVTERLLNRNGTPTPDPDTGLPAPAREARLCVPDPPDKILFKVLAAASFAVLFDITMEPLAVHINGYWVWQSTNTGYHVPTSNFAAWWVTSLLLVGILLLLQRAACQARSLHYRPILELGGSRFRMHPSRLKQVYPWLPPLLYIMNMNMFVVVNVAHAQVGEAIIGGTILGYLVYDWVKPSVARRLMSAESNGRQRET